MPIKIQTKHSAVKDKAPQPTDLIAGELAVNIHQDSPAIYLKDAAGTVRKVAGLGSVSTVDATDAVKGIVELATAAETTTGTDATRAVTPAGLKVELDKKANLASPALTGTPTAPTAAAGTNTTQLATTAFVHAAVAAEDLWDRTGTEISPKTAGDSVFTAGAVKVGGTTASPNITLKADGNIDAVCAADAHIHISKAGGDTAAIGVDGTGINTHCYVGGGNYLDFRAGGLTADKAWGVLTPVGNFNFGGGASLVSAPNLQFTQAGNINSKGALARVYADNGSAKAGGLVDGDIYRTATGQLMLVFT